MTAVAASLAIIDLIISPVHFILGIAPPDTCFPLVLKQTRKEFETPQAQNLSLSMISQVTENRRR
jgi:hypothetical protein